MFSQNNLFEQENLEFPFLRNLSKVVGPTPRDTPAPFYIHTSPYSSIANTPKFGRHSASDFGSLQRLPGQFEPGDDKLCSRNFLAVADPVKSVEKSRGKDERERERKTGKREREREAESDRERERYIYIYTQREKEREQERGNEQENGVGGWTGPSGVERERKKFISHMQHHPR